MTNTKWFLLGFSVILCISVAATYNTPNIKVPLTEYQEECYEYKQIQVVKNFTWQDWNDYTCCFSGGWLYCHCALINRTISYNSTINGDCLKYHLVRYEK
jgi:hypothetical protein